MSGHLPVRPCLWRRNDAVLIKRVLQALLIILLMTVIVFIGLHAVGNPIDILIGPDADQRDRARIIAQMGLDKHYGCNIFISWPVRCRRPGQQLCVQPTGLATGAASATSNHGAGNGRPGYCDCGRGTAGLIAGLYSESIASRTIMTGSILGFSLPTFWVGLVLIMAFSVSLGWLPSSGRGQTVTLFGYQWSFLTLDGLRHMLLPAVNLALFKVSLVIRLTYAGVQEVLPLDYIRFARAKGLSNLRVIGVHVLRNIMIPLVTVLGLEFGSTIAGAW